MPREFTTPLSGHKVQVSQPSDATNTSDDSGKHIQQDADTDQQLNQPETDNPTQAAVTWMLKVRNRNDELKKFFGLPSTENFLDEFHCALRKRVLLQGRMYIFDNNVCFYSNVFGFVKKRVIVLQDVVSVKRKTNFRFPNSIELEDGNGGKDFFTSFLSRDTAYRLIINRWQQACGRERIHKTSGGWTRLSPAEEAERDKRNNQISVNGSPSPADQEELPVPSTPLGYHNDRTIHSLDPANAAVAGTQVLSASQGNNLDEEEGSEGESEEDQWEVHNAPPPPWRKSGKLVLEADLPCSPREFYDRCLSDRNHFLEDFHQDQGDRRISMSPWRRHEQLGHVRDMSFQSPIKGAFASWGKTHTQAYQTQRFVVYQNEHLVFETSQVMNDIPYGDCFTVDIRWDLRPVEGARLLHIAIYLDVPFSRKCFFKTIIENSAYKQVQETCISLVDAAKQTLLRRQSLQAVNISSQLTPFATESGQALLSSEQSRSQQQHSATLAPIRSNRASATDADDLRHLSPLPSVRTGGSVVPEGEGGRGSVASPDRKQRCGTSHILLDAMQRLGSGAANTLSSVVDMAVSVVQQSPAAVLMAVLILMQLGLILHTWLAARAPPTMSPAVALPADPAYWSSRLGLLQTEMGLLQSRMDLVAREIGLAMQQLQAPTGGGAASPS